jgi:hypothetical protein
MSNSDGMSMGSIVFNMLSNMGQIHTDKDHAKIVEEYTRSNQVYQASHAEELSRLSQARLSPEACASWEVPPMPTVESSEGISHWGIYLEDKSEAPMVVREAPLPLPEVPTTAIALTSVATNIDLEAKARAAGIQEHMRSQDFGYMAQEDVMTVKPIVVASGSTVLCFWREKAGSGQGRKIGPKLYLSPKNGLTENVDLLKVAYTLYRAYGKYE